MSINTIVKPLLSTFHKQGGMLRFGNVLNQTLGLEASMPTSALCCTPLALIKLQTQPRGLKLGL